MNTATSSDFGFSSMEYPSISGMSGNSSDFNFELEQDLWEATKIPYVKKNVKIFSPGTHSGHGGTFEYTQGSIKYAYENTDWNEQTCAIYLEHRDEYTYDPATNRKTKPTGADARDWAGFVRNQRYENGHILGDLWIYDKQTAVKIAAGAKMGISPRGSGKHQDGKVMNMLIENYSITVNPAIKTTYFNFAMSEYGKPEMDTEIKEVLDSIVKNQETLSEENKTLSASVKELQEQKPEDSPEDEEKKKKKKEEEEKENEMAEAEKALLGELKENFLKFKSDYSKKNPDASDSDIKSAYSKLGEGEGNPTEEKPEDKPKDKLEGKSEEDKKKEEEEKETQEKELKELKELKEENKSLKTKLREPDANKGNPSGSDEIIDTLSEGSDEGMMKFLQHNFGGGVLAE